MKKVIIYFFAFFCLFDLVAQDFTIKWDENPIEDFTCEQIKAININPYCDRFFAENPNKYTNFFNGISPDSTKFLSVKIEKNNEKQDNENIRLKLEIKSNNKLLHQLDFELPYLEKNIYISEKCISNDNMVYIIADINSTKEEVKKGSMPQMYRIFCINPVTVSIQNTMLNPENVYVTSYTVNIDKDNNLKVFGFYSDKIKGNVATRNVIGYFTFELSNTSGTPKQMIKENFSDKLYNQTGWPKSVGIGPLFNPRYIWHKKGLGTIVILECEMTFDFKHTDYSSTVNQRTGNYDRLGSHVNVSHLFVDLIILSIGENGKEISLTHIPKQQKVIDNHEICSIYATHFKDKTYIIFNDHEKNVINNDYKIKIADPEFAQPVIVQINEDGTYTKKPIAPSYKESKLKLDIILSGKISDNEVMLVNVGLKKNKKTIGHLTIK